MRVADQDYILALHNGGRVVNYATFTFTNGQTKTLGPSDFRISGNTYTDKTTNGNSFSVGSFIGKTVNICIDNTSGEFDDYDFYMSRFILKESIQINSNTVKHVIISEFTVVTDVTPGTVIRFSGVDSSYKFDKKHNLTGSKTFKQIVSAACANCLGSATFDDTGNFDLYTTVVDTSKINANITWRQIISYVAMATGYNAYIDPTGLLKFKWYDFSVFDEDGLDGGTFDTNTTPYSDGDTADGGDFTFSEITNYDGGNFTDIEDYHIIQSYKNFQIGTYDISITGVRVINGETVVEIPSSHQYNYSYPIEVKNNPLCEGIESTIASHLAGKLNDFTFRIFSCKVACDPLIEAGDMALVIDTKGIAHKTIINEVQFTTGGFTQIACKAESIIRQQGTYTSEAAKAVVEANRHTDETLSFYDEAVQRMNRLAQNANGLYDGRVQQADGSFINYVSDHQITYWPDGSAKFVLHSFVAKETGAGYFYSTNSGDSDLGEYTGSVATNWTGGIDKNGNAVLNTLSVLGLVADWIRSGTLTVGGSGTGAEIEAFDENDDGIFYLNHEGATIYRGIIRGADGKNYFDLNNDKMKFSTDTEVYGDSFDYEDSYRPTNNNYPANTWTTEDEKRVHVGNTFYDSSMSIPYVYSISIQNINESTHPTENYVDEYYVYETGLSSIKLVFNSRCELENNADFLYIYYYDSTTRAYFKKELTGFFGAETVYIKEGKFWLHYHTDSSVNEWGWKIDSIEVGDGTSSSGFYYESALPSYDWKSGIAVKVYEWKEATLDNYIQTAANQLLAENLTTAEIFNLFTDGGKIQGLFMQNGQVYFNAEYIGTGAIRIGGSAYQSKPELIIKDTSDNEIGRWDKDGINAEKGQFGGLKIYESGKLYIGSSYSSGDRTRLRNGVLEFWNPSSVDQNAEYTVDGFELTPSLQPTNYDYLKASFSDGCTIKRRVSGTVREVSWTSPSDKRLKEDITNIDTELSKAIIDSVEPMRFKFKKEQGIHYGMLAQDVREILNELGEKDSKLEYSQGNMNDLDDQRALNYEEFIPHIINYIKMQQAEIDELKGKIKILKGEK